MGKEKTVTRKAELFSLWYNDHLQSALWNHCKNRPHWTGEPLSNCETLTSCPGKRCKAKMGFVPYKLSRRIQQGSGGQEKRERQSQMANVGPFNAGRTFFSCWEGPTSSHPPPNCPRSLTLAQLHTHVTAPPSLGQGCKTQHSNGPLPL